MTIRKPLCILVVTLLVFVVTYKVDVSESLTGHILHRYRKHRAKLGQALIILLIIAFFQQRVTLLLE